MSTRTSICGNSVAAVVAALVMVIPLSPAHGEEFPVTDSWSIQITAAVKSPAAAEPVKVNSTPDEDPQRDITRPIVDPVEYSRVFRSIPFNRAEYNANPSYRHDAAMEILTGNARHQTIVQHKNSRPQPAATPVGVIPYRYNNPHRGLNYYFYFPYWNYRGF